MSSKTSGKSRTAAQLRARRQGNAVRRQPGTGRNRTVIYTVLAVVAVIGVLYLIYDSGKGGDADGVPSGYRHVSGQPGTGSPAPTFALPASSGGHVSLADYRGRSVLLFFQEGLGCQPCWDQIRDLEKNQAALQAAGIDAVVSITTDPLGPMARKVNDENLSTPVLSDPGLDVSRAYATNRYGMMGMSRNGHSFILVGPDGTIDWRADYGGSPDYTMYLPTNKMLADLAQERRR